MVVAEILRGDAEQPAGLKTLTAASIARAENHAKIEAVQN